MRLLLPELNSLYPITFAIVIFHSFNERKSKTFHDGRPYFSKNRNKKFKNLKKVKRKENNVSREKKNN